MKVNFPRQTGITKQTFALLHRPEKLAWLNAQAPKGQVNLIMLLAVSMAINLSKAKNGSKGSFDPNQEQP